jgi:proliferating cell nuclear antigen
MRLTIENKSKLEIFVSIFQLLKHWNSHISMHFETERLYIQSMDKSHICLADIEIKKNWFSNYDSLKDINIAVDANHFAILMNYALKNDILELKFEDEYEPDKLFINFLNGKENETSFDHFFELNLIDVEQEELGIPSVDYDVEFTIETKKFIDTLLELNIFGQNVNIRCDENIIELNSNSDSTKVKINIPVEQLDEYAIDITEEPKVDVAFSLNHLCKMCTSLKLSGKINVSVSKDYPMLLVYNLGDDSKVSFFIAPKVSD